MDVNEIKDKNFFTKKIKGFNLRLPDLARLSIRVFKVRTARTLLTIFGFSIGIGMVLFLVALGTGLQAILIGNLVTTEDSLISLEVFYPDESNFFITNDDVEKIDSLESASTMSFISEFPAEIDIGGLKGFLNAKIIDANYFDLSGTDSDIGSSFDENSNGIIISSTALKLFEFENNDKVLSKVVSFSVFYPGEDEGTVLPVESDGEIPILGIINDEFSPPFIFIPNNIIEEKPPYFQRMFVKATDINTVESLRDSLIEMGFIISAKLDLINQARKIMNAITVVLGVFGATALIVSSVGMFNTMTISFLERIYEVGIMKSIGASAKSVRRIFLSEAFLMGLSGGVGGIALGFFAGEIVNLGLNFLANSLGGKSVNLFIYPTNFLIFIIIMSVVVGLISGFLPAHRAAKLSPKEAFERK